MHRIFLFSINLSCKTFYLTYIFRVLENFLRIDLKNTNLSNLIKQNFKTSQNTKRRQTQCFAMVTILRAQSSQIGKYVVNRFSLKSHHSRDESYHDASWLVGSRVTILLISNENNTAASLAP